MLVVRRIRFAAEDPSPMWKVVLPLIRPLLRTPNKGAATSVYLAGFVELDPLARTRVTDDGAKRFVGCYRDSDGRQRSAGTYTSRRAAERAAHREEVQVRDGAWHDTARGEIPFKEYVETVWLPLRGWTIHTTTGTQPCICGSVALFDRRPC